MRLDPGRICEILATTLFYLFAFTALIATARALVELIIMIFTSNKGNKTTTRSW